MEKETANEDMTEVEFTASLEDFANTGRAGRRNAMPNVLDPVNAAVETGSLPFELDKLKCSDPEEGKSDSACAAPSSSQGGAPSNPPGS